MSRNPGMQQIGEVDFQNVLAGDYPNITKGIVLKAGQVYSAGSVLGKATGTGMCALVDSSQSDGTESIYAILLDDVDATAVDTPAIGFLTGEFNANRLKFGGSDTVAIHEGDARTKGIFFKVAAAQ